MAAPAIPASVQLATIQWLWTAAIGDETTVPTGLTVTFDPAPEWLQYTAATPHMTIAPWSVVGTIDTTDGTLRGPDGNENVTLLPTDDTDLNPSAWTYQVTVRQDARVLMDFPIEAPGGVTTDLATVTPIAGSTGNAVVQGPPGPPNTLTAGTATTGAPGTDMSFTITGEAPNQVLNMTIPRGDGVPDPATAERGAVLAFDGTAAVWRPTPGLADRIAAPLYIAHRGGGWRFGEYTMDGYDAAAASGIAIECDVQALTDGSLVSIHDSTVDRTMTGTGSVATMTRAQWEALRVKNTGITGTPFTGAPLRRGVYFEDVLDRWGGRCLIVPEAKLAGVTQPMVDAIVARRLQRDILFQSFDQPSCATAAAAGIASMLLLSTAPDANLIASIVADDIEYVGLDSSIAQSAADACMAAGLKVIWWTVNTRSAVDGYLAAGAIGAFSDNPWWVSRRIEFTMQDPYATATPAPFGPTSFNGSGRQVAFRSRGFGLGVDSSAMMFTRQTWAPPATTGRRRITWTVDWSAFGVDQTSWSSIAYGRHADEETAYVDGVKAGQYAVHCLVRRSGSLDIYLNDGSAAVQKTTTAGPTAVAAGVRGTSRLMLEVTATTVTVTNIDTAATVTWTDSTPDYRSPGAAFTFGFKNTSAAVRDIQVEELA